MRACFCLLFIWGMFALQAQTVSKAFSPEHPLQNLSVTRWTDEEGLASNNVTSVFQASNGLLWLTSFNGFMNFDGRYFDIFDRTNISFLDVDGFYNLVEEPKGTLLFGSQGNGILKFENGTFKPLTVEQGEIPKSVRRLLKTTEGDILIGSTNTGLFRIHDQKINQVSDNRLNHTTVVSLIEDKNGVVWIGTEGEGLFSLYKDSIRRYSVDDGLLSNSVLSLGEDQSGALLIGTAKGLFTLTNGAIRRIEETGEKQINAIWVDEWNSIWLGLERGLARLNRSFKSFEIIYSKRDIDFVRITHIMSDREKNIWITSNRSGLIRVKETSISNLTKPLLTSDRVNIIHEAPDGTLYIGSDENIIDICKDGVCKQMKISSLADDIGVRSIYAENNQSIWLATYAGIIHVLNGKEIVYDRKWGMPADDFRVIHKDQQGNFWFASRSGGLVKFKEGKILQRFGIGAGFESNYVLSIAESEDGKIYVGTHSGGLNVIDTEGKVKTYHLKSDDAGVLLFNIDIDNQEKVWITANIGPLYIKGDSLRPIKLKADQRSKTYFDWVDDQHGHCLITTNVGILQILKSDIIAFVEQKPDEVPFVILDDSDGMNNRECTGATRSLQARSGLLYVPTLGGVCVINPVLQNRNMLVPPVRIAHFITDGIDHSLNAPILEIKPGTLRYSFRFGVLSYIAPRRNQFRYILEPFDEDWSTVVTDSEVEYTNLPPGKYTFRVQGSNDNKIWNEEGDSITFIVKPYFYQTIWFYLLLLMLVLAILSLLYWWRITLVNRQNEALKKVNTELDRFVYSASHDLRSPLSSLLGLINVAKNDESWDKQEYLSLMEKSVKKLDFFIRDIIDFSRNARLEVKYEAINFEELLQDILDDLHYIENFDRIDKRTTINVSGEFYSDTMRIRVVLSNLIANAIKHHYPERIENPYILIEVKGGSEEVVIQIQDNGPGINEKHLNDIFKMFFRASQRTSGSGLGLYIVQETINRLGGNISVASKIDEGTTFTVTLPGGKKTPS